MLLRHRQFRNLGTIKSNGESPLSSTLQRGIEKYSRFRPTPLTIQHFLEFGRRYSLQSSYQFLQVEIPVRLSGILKELHFLPEELRSTEQCREIHRQYCQSLEEIIQFENRDNHDNHVHAEFTEVLKRMYERHADTVTTMALAVISVKQRYDATSKLPKFENNIQYFLDRLYMSRISTRMLINQHVILHEDDDGDGLVGAIDPKCDVLKVVERAFENARFLCEQYYLNAPKLNIKIHDVLGEDRIRFVYVPSHMYHILFELFKNAMRATVEYAEERSYDLPPISITIVRSHQDLSIKVSDLGGGIPRRLKKKVFQYLYTTAPEPVLTPSTADPGNQVCVGGVPLAGYGYGLPLSRLYARYFAGDLEIYSVDGYGTDAVIYFKADSKYARENLPIYHEGGSRKIYEAQLTPSDWTDERS